MNHMCQANVPYNLCFYRTRKCKNKANIEINGIWYCGVHNPNKIDERKEKSEIKKEQKRKYDFALYLHSLKQKNNNKE